MTTRDLTTAMEAAIAAGTVRPVIFYEGSFYASGSPDEVFLRLWSGLGTFSWDGKNWDGAGKLLSISPLEESAEVKSVGFNVTLSGLPSAELATALQNVRQGRPGRVWLGLMGREGYLELPGQQGDYASTPDSAAVSVTGDIDVRCKLALNDWTPATIGYFLGKYISTANGSYLFSVAGGSTGRLGFEWVEGVTVRTASSTVPPVVSDGATIWLRVTLDVDNRAGGRDVKFYTSADGVTWSQLGATVTSAGVTSIQDSTAKLNVGAYNDGGTGSPIGAGKVYYAEIRNGIDGTVVASFDPSTDGHLGATTMTSSETGEVWTINQSGSPRAELVVNNNYLIADPYLIRAGRMDYVGVAADGDTTSITAQYEDRLVDLGRSRERRYTDEDQQFEYAGDLGFEFVAALQDKQLIWGGPGAASSPVAMPTAAAAERKMTYKERRQEYGAD